MRIIMIAMEPAPEKISPAMESVWRRDMLSAMDHALLKSILTVFSGIVEANASRTVNSVTALVLREELNVVTTCALMTIPSIGLAAQTTGNATAPASINLFLVIRPASLDTISATTSMILTKMVTLTRTMTTAWILV